MALSDRASYHTPIDLEFALAHPENTITEVFDMTDAEGLHEAVAATLSLGAGNWGADGVPWNLCSGGGGSPSSSSRRRYTYGHG